MRPETHDRNVLLEVIHLGQVNCHIGSYSQDLTPFRGVNQLTVIFSLSILDQLKGSGANSGRPTNRAPPVSLFARLLRQQDRINHVDDAIGRGDICGDDGGTIDLDTSSRINCDFSALDRFSAHFLASYVSCHNL
jgi:hypothetical protein